MLEIRITEIENGYLLFDTESCETIYYAKFDELRKAIDQLLRRMK